MIPSLRTAAPVKLTGLANCLRITVGTAEENETLLRSLGQILGT